MNTVPRAALFSLGSVVATPGAMNAVEGPFETALMLARHQSGDWGDMDKEDCRTNDRAVGSRQRIMSAYTTESGVKVWIITEASRDLTTILLPSEY